MSLTQRQHSIRSPRPSDLNLNFSYNSSSAHHYHQHTAQIPLYSKPSRYAPARLDRGSMNSTLSTPSLTSDTDSDDDLFTPSPSWHPAPPPPSSILASPLQVTRKTSTPNFPPSRPVGHEAFISHKAHDSFSRRFGDQSPRDPWRAPESPGFSQLKFLDTSFLPPAPPPPTTPLPQIPNCPPARPLRTAKSHGVLSRSQYKASARPVTPPSRVLGTSSVSYGHSSNPSTSSFSSRANPRRPARPDEKSSWSPFPAPDIHQVHRRNHSRQHSNAASLVNRPLPALPVAEDEMLFLHQLCLERSRVPVGRPAVVEEALGTKSAFDEDDSEGEKGKEKGNGLQRMLKGLQKRGSQEKVGKESSGKGVFSRMFARK